MTWRFDLPFALTSANDHVVNGNHAVAAAMYRKRRDRWAWALRVAALTAGVPLLEGCEERRFVRITRLWGKRQRLWDDDNMTAACKALRDAMQRPRQFRGRWVPGAAIVVDDGPKWSVWDCKQARAVGDAAMVRVEVQSLAAEAAEEMSA